MTIKTNFLVLIFTLVFSLPSLSSPLKIGAIFSFEDVTTPLGKQDGYRGIQLFIEHINEKGGINGRPLKLSVKISDGTPEDALKRTEELVSDPDILAVIGLETSSEAIASTHIYKKEKLAHLAVLSSNPKVTRDSHYVYSMIFHDHFQAARIATYTKSVLKPKKVLVIYDNTLYGTGLYEGFMDKAKKVSLTSIDTLELPKKELQQERALINLFKQTDYDVVALLMHNESAEHITKFFTQQNLSPAIVGPDALDRKHFALESGHYKGEIYVASPFIFGITNLEAQKFASSFKKKYKTFPGLEATFMYDAGHVIASALKSNEVHNRQNILNYLASIKSAKKAIKGITGTLFFDEHGAMNRPLYMKIIEKGNFFPAFTQLIQEENSTLIQNKHQKMLDGELIELDKEYFYLTKVVRAGIDVFRVDNIDIPGQIFDAEFFLWLRWEGKLDIKNIDVINGIYGIEDKTEVLRQSLNGSKKYICYKIKGTYVTPFNLRKFPFDSQELPLTLGHKTKDSNKVMMTIDTQNLSYYPIKDIYPEGWAYKQRDDFSGTFIEHSTFGDPTYTATDGNVASDISFSVYNSNIVVSRLIHSYIITLFCPLLLMILLSFLIFVIPIDNLDTRLSLVMTTLLTIVVFHMVQRENLPSVGYMTLIDYYFITSYALMLVLALHTVFTNLWIKKDKKQLMLKFEKIAKFIYIAIASSIYASLTVNGFSAT